MINIFQKCPYCRKIQVLRTALFSHSLKLGRENSVINIVAHLGCKTAQFPVFKHHKFQWDLSALNYEHYDSHRICKPQRFQDIPLVSFWEKNPPFYSFPSCSQRHLCLKQYPDANQSRGKLRILTSHFELKVSFNVSQVVALTKI